MQIKKIILYSNNPDDEPRVINFNTGALNIITGESKSGKSALVGIIDYCLGSKKCKIYDGVIRTKTHFFAILITFGDEDVFISRLNPDVKNKGTIDEIFVKRSYVEKELPSIEEFTPNFNTSLLKSFLSEKLKINENIHIPISLSREPLEANFRHARIFSFQPQYVIAQPNQLFYNQDDSYVKMAIKDTLPYFLGAINADSLQVEAEISKKKRLLNQLIREKREEEKLKEDGVSKAYSLIEEAKEIGLLDKNKKPNSVKEAYEILESVKDWEHKPIDLKGDDSGLKKLIEERLLVKHKLGKIEDDINAVKHYMKTASKYSNEIRQQEIRLESIGFFNNEVVKDPNICPLCDNHLIVSNPTIENINSNLLEIRNDLKNTTQESPRVQSYLNNLDNDQIKLQNQLEIAERGITALYNQKDKARTLRDLNIRRGRVIGRVSLFLENINLDETNSQLEVKVKTLKHEIEILLGKVDKESNEDKLNSILNRINIQMTEWSNLIDVEYQGNPIRFDIKNLDLIVDTEDKPISLSTGIGSGANWVAYHLLLLMALHKSFITKDRPVPRFLFIDQPTQVYYPPEINPNIIEIDSEGSSDDKAVKAMFDFMHKVAKELSPNFQIIVMDHALLNTPEFEESIVEIWRDGKKLIPQKWIDNIV
ncbi:DUF3732 domain-containing protein [Olleya namhaensis]|uniref:AAA domain-containing protein n=1 Tax=Olleya namhaensis TaxID=1144750 RepID=A0A1I3R7K6_9FLAO|nr:DUF3732 domain-containing protein [Olleya namhaensis]SFJ42603.1 Protein of unknown function [Olleya namhaensis]